MATAERWLNIMIELSRVRHSTMPELAEKFGVSVRTIQRDILALTPIMPIGIKYGKYEGGVYIIGDYSFDRVYMEQKQIDLLLKVRDISIGKISEDELVALNQIIKTYTKPSAK